MIIYQSFRANNLRERKPRPSLYPKSKPILDRNFIVIYQTVPEMGQSIFITERSMTVSILELSMRYGSLDLLTAYIMRTTGMSQEQAENIVYAIDTTIEMQLEELRESEEEE